MTSSGGSRLIQLGAFIREQRKHAQLSLRNLAAQAGVSNPYLSQIERGLRKPSAEILQAIARALQISAETLYVKAGILEEREDDLSAAILGDSSLTERQRRALLEVYRSFKKEAATQEAATRTSAHPEPEVDPGNVPEG
jgi:transcriptional regulator with XRE-family HTH domain